MNQFGKVGLELLDPVLIKEFFITNYQNYDKFPLIYFHEEMAQHG